MVTDSNIKNAYVPFIIDVKDVKSPELNVQCSGVPNDAELLWILRGKIK